MIRHALLPALALCAALPAAAQEVRPADTERLEAWETSFGHAVRQAFAGGSPADLAALAGAMAGEPADLDPVGDWTCNTIKMGDVLPIVVYPPFRCTVTEAAPGVFHLRKVTGSQQMEGDIFAEREGLYLGTGYVAGGPSSDYAGLPPDSQESVEPGQTVAQVGYFEQTGPNAARLLLADPILESDFDILRLTR